jgi:hypothetical protein
MDANRPLGANGVGIKGDTGSPGTVLVFQISLFDLFKKLRLPSKSILVAQMVTQVMCVTQRNELLRNGLLVTSSQYWTPFN